MVTSHTTVFDPAQYLESPEAIVEYLTAAFETEDQAVILDALGVAARAKGMTALAAETGLTRPALYKALRPEGHPEFSTILSVCRGLGVGFAPVVRKPDAAKESENA